MSTNLKPTKNHLLTNFYGGVERGRCIQVTTKQYSFDRNEPRFIQLSKKDALEMIIALSQWLNDEREEIYN